MHQQQHHQQQQQQYQQQQQPYNPQQQMEDYTHYPHPEEYMSERNRAAYFANGDQYAMPSKPRQRLESDCKFFNISFLLFWIPKILTKFPPLSLQTLTLAFYLQIPHTETCLGFQTHTLGTTSPTSCASRVSTCTDLSMTSLRPPLRATPPPTGASSGRSSFEHPERPARFL